MKKYLALSMIAVVVACGFALAQDRQWVHVRVASEGEEKFNLNVPLSLIDTVLPMIEDKEFGSRRSHGVRWENHEWTLEELRELWNAVKQERGYDLATFGNRDSEVRLFLDEKYLRVESEDSSRDRVSARIPISVVDALLSGSGERLDLSAAIDALKQLGSDELISVEAERGSVQVWIDAQNR